MSRGTDEKVFEPEWIGSDETGWEKKSYRGEWLPDAEEQGDINLLREENVGALVNIEQRFVVHSPSGFEWGYGGSGPADLALNILALFVPPPEAWRLHQRYKFSVIGGLSREVGVSIVIKADDVRDWIVLQWAIEAACE